MLAPLFTLALSCGALCEDDPYPHNAVSCERCHSVPTEFGGSSMTVQRIGTTAVGEFVPASEGGIHHRNGESAQSSTAARQISGDRVSLSLLGDGYIEAIDSREIDRNAQKQRQAHLGIAGAIVSAPPLEAGGPSPGRFGWKSQHSSLMFS